MSMGEAIQPDLEQIGEWWDAGDLPGAATTNQVLISYDNDDLSQRAVGNDNNLSGVIIILDSN